VQTIITRGTLTQVGSEIPIVTYNKRPNKVKIEGLFQDVKFIESFDGKNGWTYNPFGGNTKPVLLEPEYLETLKDRADIDGLLYNYKEKGYEYFDRNSTAASRFPFHNSKASASIFF